MSQKAKIPHTELYVSLEYDAEIAGMVNVVLRDHESGEMCVLHCDSVANTDVPVDDFLDGLRGTLDFCSAVCYELDMTGGEPSPWDAIASEHREFITNAVEGWLREGEADE